MYMLERRVNNDLQSSHVRRASSTSVSRPLTQCRLNGVRRGHWQSTVSLPAAAVTRCHAADRLNAGHVISGQRSTTAGVGGGSRAVVSKQTGGLVTIKVLMLDDQIVPFHIQRKVAGRELFQRVNNYLNLLEVDYFGLEYQDCRGIKFWLDLDRPMNRQIALDISGEPIIWFCVKFYTPDPTRLEEELTRFLFALQIKRDLRQDVLLCNDNTTALMVSYIMQAECGDQTYCGDEGCVHYLRTRRSVSRLDEELERRIIESHKRLAGLSPAEAELNLLETARRCEMYGIKMHPARDHENTQLNLAVTSSSIVVFHQHCKINTFSWPKIRKLSFKRRRFLIKLHPDNYSFYKDTAEFYFSTRNYCKNFWKKCVENHGFYRCERSPKAQRNKPRVIPQGSCFRFTGRTQQQLIEFVRANIERRRAFQGSQSFRSTTSLHLGHGLTSSAVRHLSAQPLIPTDLLTQDSSGGRSYSSSYGSVSVLSPAVQRTMSTRSTPQTTEHDMADLDTMSRADLSTSTMNSLSTPRIVRHTTIFSARAHCRSRRAVRSSMDADRMSPESEISSTLTDSLRPMRVSCSSRSLSEAVEDTEDTASRTRAAPVRGGLACRQLWRQRHSGRYTSLNGGSESMSECQDGDNASHDSYDLLEDGPAVGWSSDRELPDGTSGLLYADRPSQDDGEDNNDADDTSFSVNSSQSVGEINLIPFSASTATNRIIADRDSDSAVILPPEPFLERRVDGVKTLPRPSHSGQDGRLSVHCPQARSVERLDVNSTTGTGAHTFPNVYNHYHATFNQNSVLFVNDMDPQSSELSSKYAFVEVHQLPAKKAFSCRDDSLEDSTNLYSSPLPLDRHHQANEIHFANDFRHYEDGCQYGLDDESDKSATQSISSVEHGPNFSSYDNVSPYAVPNKVHRPIASPCASTAEEKDQEVTNNTKDEHLLDIPNFTLDMVRRNSSPQIHSNSFESIWYRRVSLPDECLKILLPEPTVIEDKATDDENSDASAVGSVVASAPEEFGATEFGQGAELRQTHPKVVTGELVSTLSETSCVTDDDDSTLQYDTVPDESEAVDLEVPEEFADTSPSLPPVEYRIVYEPMRALSRISERSTTSEMDSRLSTLTKKDHTTKPIRSGGTRAQRSLSVSSEEPDTTESLKDPDFPSPPSSLMEPSPIVHTISAQGADANIFVVADESIKIENSESLTTVSSRRYSHHSEELECAQTAGADSDEDEGVDAVEELPGDDDCAQDDFVPEQFHLEGAPDVQMQTQCSDDAEACAKDV